MSPSANTTAFHSNTDSTSKDSAQDFTEEMKNNSPPLDPAAAQNVPNAIPAPPPRHEQWSLRDNPAYEDKWIGWDGPVWCHRYGRFENKAQAAEDDGYSSDDPAASRSPKTYQIHRCQRDGCACRAPVEHQSYAKDIQRRIEPMMVSLMALEHQVGKLVHHVVKDGEHAVVNALNHEDGKERFAMHAADGQQADELMHQRFHQHHLTMAETIANLEGKVHGLTHQLHVLVRQNDELLRNRQAGPGEHQHWQVPQQQNLERLGGIQTH